MHIRTDRERLLPVLSKVVGVIERRQTLPILGNIFINAAGDLLTLIGTDLEIEIRAQIDAEVREAGEITLPARKFIDICKAVPENTDIFVHVHDQRATITAGKSRFNLSTLPAIDFPFMESSDSKGSIELDPQIFKEMLEKTSFAMANQDVRYYLNGLYLKLDSQSITVVATDGHRMAKIGKEMAFPISEALEVILPRKTILELSRLLGSTTERMRMDLGERMMRVTVGEILLTSKLVDGRYPDYQRVIPILADKVAYVDREMLRQSLQRTSILSNEKYKGIRLEFKPGLLKLQAHNPEQEEAEEEIDIDYTQEPTAIGFNVSYLLDVLHAVGEERIEIRFTNSDSSALLRGEEREDQTFVVMPMRL